jgi:hypothetical protein
MKLNIGDFVYFDSAPVSAREVEWKSEKDFSDGEWVIAKEDPEEVVMGKCTYQGMWIRKDRSNTENIFSLLNPVKTTIDEVAEGFVFFHHVLRKRFLVNDQNIKVIPASLLEEQPQI